MPEPIQTPVPAADELAAQVLLLKLLSGFGCRLLAYD